jgi:PAS domain S-box-containing protein
MLRAIYQSTTEASTFIDRDFIIRYNNQVTKDITKQIFGREAQIGENSLDYFLPQYQEEFRNYYEKVLSGESFVLERTDGNNWWQIILFPVYDEHQNIIGIANNVQDITDRKNKEQKLIQQNEILQQIAWQQSHELRRPVANILGLCDLLKNYDKEPKETQRTFIDYMLKATNELDEIIHKIVLQANESEYNE